MKNLYLFVTLWDCYLGQGLAGGDSGHFKARSATRPYQINAEQQYYGVV